MKNWIIYFFCVMLGIGIIPFGAKKAMGESEYKIRVEYRDEISEMTMDEFVLRVLVAQNDYCKSFESKKALAVAIRSCGYYLSCFGCKHDDFDVCDSADCCFALGDIENSSESIIEQCRRALNDTKGLVLTYNSMPAMGIFHLCSGSGTDFCADFPYLSAVSEEIPCQEHIYEETCDFATLDKLGIDKTQLSNSVLVYNDNKKCDFAIISGKCVSATEIMEILNIKSSEFGIEFSDTQIKIKGFGIGNGYGMSLCGAEKMAVAGKDYVEILENYFPDLELNKMYNN